ncbi:MAG: hypothetical protein V7704_09740 [Aurantimonas endophytica]|uniref:Uncharacterized protein n=1 Tax=Aurantimonas endophytica TaxID=1522175 RepID=A0A7W6HHB6_9HYPH|nr:hypothetical protein [Aurantimonas endophytica]MBB4005183.1 hypothetical protein [Aurantimonas endophytica]MCO6406154.1 hypothetical protein [Aurantimonas endophytica]
MIRNPFEAVPFKEAAWAEGFCNGLAAITSPVPSDSISEEDFDAFNDGVAVGADVAENGIAFDSPCVAALEGSPGHGVALAIDGAHLLHAGWHARHLAGLAGAFAGLLVVIVSVGTSAHHSLPAEQVLPGLGDEITATLEALGTGSLEFFSGVNLDLSSEDCTMSMSPLFMSLEQAQASAEEAAGPDGWIVVSWRTDQSNSFRIVSSSNQF